MRSKRIINFSLSAIFALSMVSVPVARAQDPSSSPLGAADSPTPKQIEKSQKKAERKARRAKKNAEISDLQKNGYSPTGEQQDYPQNVQAAQQKLNSQRQNAKPASAP